MDEKESPECIRIFKAFLQEVDCFDRELFESAGGYSAMAQLNTLESLWRDLNSQKELYPRAAEQRNEAVRHGQICPLCDGRGELKTGLKSVQCWRCNGIGHI